MPNLDILFKYFVNIALLSLILYIPRMIYWISGFKKQQKISNPTKNKFAVLVPARNESVGIGLLLDSLKNQTYNHKYFDTYVIVNSEEDPTCEIAKKYKNTFVQVVKNQTCKGEALDGSLKEILRLAPDYAAYIIVDGDNVVDSKFVEEMNNALLLNSQIVLGKRNIKNYLFKDKKMRSLATNCSAMIYTFLDKLGNAFRSKNGIPCTMCGTGVMIRRDVIEEIGGWPYRSYTEDLEMTINCILHKWTTCFYEYAITYTEEPLTHSVANERRKRWVFGYIQILFKYRPKIIKQTYASLFNKSFSLKDKIKGIATENFDYLYSFTPFILYMIDTVASFLIFMGIFFYSFFAKRIINLLALKYALIVLAIVYAALAFYTILGFAADKKSLNIPFSEKLKVVFYNPIFMSEWANFYISAFINYLHLSSKNEQTEWIQIERIETDPQNNPQFAESFNLHE